MIKGWKRPDLGPGPLKSLNDALHDLHARSGYRSSREIEKWIRADQGTGGISHTTVHKLFTKPELPRPELMHWVVKVLLDHSRVPDPDQVVDEFDALWNDAFEAQQHEQRLLRAKQREREQEELASSETVEIPRVVLAGRPVVRRPKASPWMELPEPSLVRSYVRRPIPAVAQPPAENYGQISVAELIARIEQERASRSDRF